MASWLPDARAEDCGAMRSWPDLLPWLRGQAQLQTKRFHRHGGDTRSICALLNSHDAPRLAELGTSCPDHLLAPRSSPCMSPGIRRG